MTDNRKARSIYSTDEEWNILKEKATSSGLSISRFILDRCLKDGGGDQAFNALAEDVKASRIGVRLLCFLAEESAKRNGRNDEYARLFNEAQGTEKEQ